MFNSTWFKIESPLLDTNFALNINKEDFYVRHQLEEQNFYNAMIGWSAGSDLVRVIDHQLLEDGISSISELWIPRLIQGSKSIKRFRCID